MAEELLLLGALLDAANRSNEAELEQSSTNWVVPCTKCDARMDRMKGHQAYNTAPNSTILCDGCRDKVPGTKYMFHCPKNQNLFHLNGFDYCLNCANKHRDKTAESQYNTYNNNNNNNNNNNTSYESQQQSQSGSYNNSASNTNADNTNSVALRQEIGDQQRTINRLRNELNELRTNNIRIKNDKNQIENRYKILENEKNSLFGEKRELNTRINDNLDLIDQQKEEIKNLKYIISSSNNMDSSKTGDIERLQNDKLESQNKYRIIKQKLDDKLDLIEQFKDDINRLKKEKEEIINNYNEQINDINNNEINDTPGTGKKNEISPTLKAIFTQKFFGDKESQTMPQKQYITKIHNEILGMAFASHATIEWMMKNCRVYDEEKNNQNNNKNNNDVFSFNTFVNAMNDNNNNNNNNNDNEQENESKPIVNLKQFDLMTIQNLQKNLDVLHGKYNQCITSTREWKVVIENILNPKHGQNKQGFNGDINGWEYWNYNDIIAWIMSLDNGRFIKYENILKMEMSKVALNGIGLKQVQNADLLMYGIDNFQDQMSLVQHIDGLTGRKQKIHANKSSPVAYQQYAINPGAAPGSVEGMEGSNTADIK